MSTVHGQTVNETITMEAPLSGQTVVSYQATYYLDEAEFLHLQSSGSRTMLAAGATGSATVGFLVGLLPKIKFEGGIPNFDAIQLGERNTLAIMLVVSVLIYVIGLVMPSERRRVTREIRKYFNDYRSRRRAGGQG